MDKKRTRSVNGIKKKQLAICLKESLHDYPQLLLLRSLEVVRVSIKPRLFPTSDTIPISTKPREWEISNVDGTVQRKTRYVRGLPVLLCEMVLKM